MADNKKCGGCNSAETEKKSVPYIVYESNEVRHERREKRLIWALIISILAVFASNALWLYAWCQYDYTSTTEKKIYQQDGQGTNIIGDSNEVDNGAESDETKENQNTP